MLGPQARRTHVLSSRELSSLAGAKTLQGPARAGAGGQDARLISCDQTNLTRGENADRQVRPRHRTQGNVWGSLAGAPVWGLIAVASREPRRPPRHGPARRVAQARAVWVDRTARRRPRGTLPGNGLHGGRLSPRRTRGDGYSSILNRSNIQVKYKVPRI